MNKELFNEDNKNNKIIIINSARQFGKNSKNLKNEVYLKI